MGFLDARVNPANLDTLTAAKIGAPGSATATALNATYVMRSESAPNSIDGGNAASTYNSGSFNFDGGSAA